MENIIVSILMGFMFSATLFIAIIGVFGVLVGLTNKFESVQSTVAGIGFLCLLLTLFYYIGQFIHG
jgi:hypothetical protein